MNIVELITRFIVGGLLIATVSLLAKSQYSLISGLFVLFPIVTLVGYYFIGQGVSAATLKDITLFSLYSLPTVLVFLLAFYFLQSKFNVNYSLLLSVLAWLFAAGLLITINHYFLHLGK